MRKNNRVARAARFLLQFLTKPAKRRREIFVFEVLTKTRANSGKCHSLPLHENHSCYSSERILRLFRSTWQEWSSCNAFNRLQTPILNWRFHFSSRCSFLNSPLRTWWYTHCWLVTIFQPTRVHELKQERRQQRGRQKTMISLVEWGKIIMLHVRHAL